MCAVNAGSGNDGNISDLPWASLFDPATNVRALGEIQARGFRAASDLVDRFVRTAAAEGAPPHRAEHDDRPDASRVGRAWQKLIGDLVDALRQNEQAAQPFASAIFDLVEDDAMGSVVIRAESAGDAVGVVWLHNSGHDGLGTVRLRCSDLLANDGSTIGSDRIGLDPVEVPMPARSSRGVVISIRIDEGVATGVYRGTLLVEGHPDIWLPVLLTVAEPS